MTDNELLIKVETTVMQMSESLKKYEQNNREDHKIIIDTLNRNIDRIESRMQHDDDNCDDCKGEIYNKIDDKVGWTQFSWIVGGITTFIIGILLTIGATTLSIDDKVDKYIIRSEEIEEVEDE